MQHLGFVRHKVLDKSCLRVYPNKRRNEHMFFSETASSSPFGGDILSPLKRTNVRFKNIHTQRGVLHHDVPCVRQAFL